MYTSVPPELHPGARILLVGRDPGEQEMRQGRPFVGPAGDLLNECLGQAGFRREDVNITNVVAEQPPGNVFARHSPAAVSAGISALHCLIRNTGPDIVVCLGNEAAWALIPDWPSTSGTAFGAYGITERRGYWWLAESGTPVIATLHPAGILRSQGHGAGAIDQMLLTYDLEEARKVLAQGFKRPERAVSVISNAVQAIEAAAAIRKAGWTTCDIEIRDKQTLACVGFAPESGRAYVFTEPVFEDAFALLRDPALKKCFHNGQFDMYFLRTRCGVDVAGFADDTIIGFHICWPALAGRAERGNKRTQKSLRFLASLYTKDQWWKDYDFADDSEMYHLNGIDCMATFDVHHHLVQERRLLGIADSIYQHELSLVWPCIKILERGLLVDLDQLNTNCRQLELTVNSLAHSIEAMAQPLLEPARDRISNPGLFWTRSVCRCCRNGKDKRDRCWSCAGFEKKPCKRDLGDTVLGPCAVCGGAGSGETFAFNFDSSDQKKILLYEVLGISPRYDEGKICVSEDKLKDILGSL